MMRICRRTHRAFTLAEFLITLLVASGVVFLLGKLTLDSIYIQRVAIQHTARIASIDALVRQLHDDARHAITYQFGDDALVLQTHSPDHLLEIRYELAEDLVRRSVNGTDTSWSARRLAFAWKIEPGPRADLLHMTFVELPPPKYTGLEARDYTVPIALPHAPADSSGGRP